MSAVACSSDPAPTPPVTDAGMDASVRLDAAADTGRPDLIMPADMARPTTACGSATCTGTDLLVVELPACCPAPNACGLEVTDAVRFARGIGISLPFTGCVALNQPGPDDARCPALDQALGSINVHWSGCCRPTGVCGLHANLRIQGVTDDAPDFGCVDSSGLNDGGASRPCGPPTDGGTDGGARD